VYLCAALAGVVAGLVIGLSARVPGRIPADARVVTVTPVFDYGSGPSRVVPGYYAFTVTDPAKVGRIAAVINGLRQLTAGTYSCPAEGGSAMMLTTMQLTFSTAPGDPAVATAGADYGGCQFAWVTVGAQTVWPLDESTSSAQPVQQQVLAIAGVRWPHPPRLHLAGASGAAARPGRRPGTTPSRPRSHGNGQLRGESSHGVSSARTANGARTRKAQVNIPFWAGRARRDSNPQPSDP